jgi:hypothetical protein
MCAHQIRTFARTLGLLITFAIGMAAILATGGGGGSDSGVQPKPSNTTISGTAAKGPIDGGTASAYALNDDDTKGSFLDSATTDGDGTFTIDLGSYTGAVIIEVTDGTYTDEATNTPVDMNTSGLMLRTALTDVSGNVTAQVTPLTEIALQVAEASSGGLSDSNINSANALVSNLIGGADILTTVPTDVLSSSADLDSLAEQKYGLALASISQLAQNRGINITTAINDIATDLNDNKMLDTMGSNIENLLKALTDFTGGTNNHASPESAEQLAALITAYTNSTVPDQAFTMNDIAGTWNLVGLVTPTTVGIDNYIVDAGFATLENTGAYTNTCLFTSEGACDTPDNGTGFSITSTGYIPALDLGPSENDYSYMSVGKSLVADLHVDTADQWQRLSFAVKRATAYSLADLEGSWVSMVLRSPVAGGSANDHAFSIESVDIAADGSATSTCIANSGGCGTPTTISGITIDNEGFITVPPNPGVAEISALSADKNIIAEISKALFDQQIFLAVRKANDYSMAELAGTWVRLAFTTPLDADHSSIANGDYGFDVGTVILNDDGTYTYTCIDSSDSSPCSTGAGTIPGVGVCNITEPLQPGESECGVVSAGKDVIVNMIIDRDNEEQELSILLRRSDLGSVGTTYNFADYMPDATQVGCMSTYQITEGTKAGETLTDAVTGTTNVPYTSGSIAGITSERRDNSNSLLYTFITSNDGSTVRFLGYNGYYISKDCDLSAPSPRWSLSDMYDDMIIDQTAMTHQVNASNLSDCKSEPGDQKLLIKVQDVTIGTMSYPNAIAMYTLDTNYPFTPLNYVTQAAAYGITLPTGFDTGGISVTDFNVYAAAGVGEIIGAGVDASTGTVNDPYELVSQACP